MVRIPIPLHRLLLLPRKRYGIVQHPLASSQTQYQVQRRLLLDVVIGQRAAVLELLSGEDQALLVGRDALLVLDLVFDVVDGVRRLHLEGDRLPRERFDEDLHRSSYRWISLLFLSAILFFMSVSVL